MLTYGFDSSRSGLVLSRELRTWRRGSRRAGNGSNIGGEREEWVKVTIRNDVEGAFDDDARFFSSFRTGHPPIMKNA